MKDIYEMFNDISVDENDIIEMEVNEIENKRIKKNIKKAINKEKRSKKSIVAAAIVAIALVTIGTTLSPYAKQIPIIRDIFNALENSIYKEYKENANEINITKESKGISITVNDAVFDGTTISLTYTVESDKNLGNNISLWSSAKIKGDNGGGTTSSDFKKISETTYVGQENIHIFDFVNNPKDVIDLKLIIHGIDNMDSMTTIDGRWSFEMTLNSVDGETILVDKSVENQELTTTINRVTLYPMSTVIAFSQSVSKEISEKYDSITTDLEVTDDLGNIYSIEGHGSTGDANFNLDSSATIEKVKEGATKLIITPKAILRKLSDVKYVDQESKNGLTGEISIDKAETYECIDLKEVILDDVIIDLKR